MFGPVGTRGPRRQRAAEGYPVFPGWLEAACWKKPCRIEASWVAPPFAFGEGGARLLCFFPLAINERIRTGTDKGNPTV